MKIPSQRLMFFFLSTIFIQYYFVSFIVAQPNKLLYHLCVVSNGNYTANSTYKANLDQLLPSLYNDTTINYGFYNSSYGEDTNKVYAIALCRPDMTPSSCRDCIKIASQLLTANCTNTKEAIGGYDDNGYNYCMLRYAARNIFRIMEDAPYFFVHDDTNFIMENVEEFNQTRNRLLDRLRSKAAAGDSHNMSAYGEEPVSDMVIYALVQCTPDISKAECDYCLQNATARTPNCCTAIEGGKNVGTTRGGRVIYPSCNFRYETNRFYKFLQDDAVPPSTALPVSPPPPPSEKGKVIIIVVTVLVTSIVIVICIYIFYRARKKAGNVEAGDEIKDAECTQFDLATIKLATDNFSDANKLGQGGFGAVFKGRLPNGHEIAVKRLSRNSKQGELEFKNEVRLVAKLQHRNLVRLIGFCVQQSERLLVYEFLPNASLDHFIFDPMKRQHFDWDRRHKIMGGIARGLLYLHEDSRDRIIHRDLKASNILLDSEMNPKISDFGMARLFELDQTQDNASRIVGTFGYMAPEYVNRGRCSVKSDVFSFGVLVLEIVSGQRRSSFHSGEDTDDLLTYAWKSWNEGTASTLIDPTLTNSSRDEMMRCIHIGLLCVQENIADRPTMATVVPMLRGDFLNLPAPSKPGFFLQSTTDVSPLLDRNSGLRESDQSRIDTSQHSRNDASITELYPR